MKFKKIAVDVLALNIFITCVAYFVEIVFSGISWDIFWRGRLMMIIPNTLVVVPYNQTRVWIGKRLGVWKSEIRHRILRDTLVFIMYRVPLILIVLLYLGATKEKIISACGFATLVSGFTGWPFGVFLDWMRKKFNVST